MTHAIKGFATFIIAIGAAAGATGQPTAFAVANDSHTPVVVMDNGAYITSTAAGTLSEGHAPIPSPR